MNGPDIDRLIAMRLDGQPGSSDVDDPVSQAIAVLVDHDLSDDQRAQAFQEMLTMLLDRLTPEEMEQFSSIAQDEGEVAALAFLTHAIPRPRSS